MAPGPTRRLVVIGALAASVVVLSGCHQILRVSLGGQDPPVHQSPPPAGRTVADAAAKGRAFTGRAEGALASRLVLKHGFVESRIKNVLFAGSFRARLAGASALGAAGLGPLGDAAWHGRFSAVRNRATGRIKLKGLVLATFTDASAGRACLRLAHRGKRKQNRNPRRGGTSKLTVLGGEGDARTLRGTASVRVRVGKGDLMKLRGRVRAKRGAARGMTPACSKLERRFGLTPVG